MVFFFCHSNIPLCDIYLEKHNISNNVIKMKQFIEKIIFKTKGSEISNITKIVEDMVKKSTIKDGLLEPFNSSYKLFFNDSRKC